MRWSLEVSDQNNFVRKAATLLCQCASFWKNWAFDGNMPVWFSSLLCWLRAWTALEMTLRMGAALVLHLSADRSAVYIQSSLTFYFTDFLFYFSILSHEVVEDSRSPSENNKHFMSVSIIINAHAYKTVVGGAWIRGAFLNIVLMLFLLPLVFLALAGMATTMSKLLQKIP